jgi:penicillin-binding protein 1A
MDRATRGLHYPLRFDPKLHPAYLSMALGVGSATPLRSLTGIRYSPIPGYARPYYIQKVVDARGAAVLEAKPGCQQTAERVIDP